MHHIKLTLYFSDIDANTADSMVHGRGLSPSCRISLLWCGQVAYIHPGGELGET